jgi:MFS transporter, DHA2 family, multidrug resistance protein
MSDVADGLRHPQRLWAIIAVMLAITMSVLDASIANIALPVISSDLHVTPADTIWVVNAYQLTITVALLAVAALGDIVGHERVFRFGIAVFTAASLGCALSKSLDSLIFFRVLQGVGSTGVFAVNTAVVRFIHPKAKLGRGMSINATTVAISSAAGPSLAAGILTLAPWPYLFFINIPVGIAALLLSRFLPKTPKTRHPFDWTGALLNAAMFGFGITAVDGIGHGGAWQRSLAGGVIAVALAVVLVRNQRGKRFPVLPVDLFAIPVFALSALTSVLSFIAQNMALVAMPFLFAARGMSTVDIGLLITPWPIAMAICAPISGRLADRAPAGKLGSFGLTMMTLGLIAIVMAPADESFLGMAWRMALCGVGFAFFQTPNNRLLISSAPRERSGAGSGVLSSCRLLGQSMGSALVAAAFGLTASHGEAVGGETALTIAAVSAFAGVIVSFSRLMV